MRSLVFAVAGLVLCSAVAVRSVAQEPVARKTVREAVYTEAQAERGKKVYEANCVTCHLPDLDGSANADAGARGAPLVGTRFVQDFGESKVSALFNKMKRDMPSGRPGTLTDQEYLDAAAFVLQRNKFPAGATELTEETAGEFWIPGAGGAEGLENYTFVTTVGCLHQDPTRSWFVTNAQGLKKTETGPGRPCRRRCPTLPASSRSVCSMRSATTPIRTRPQGARQRIHGAPRRGNPRQRPVPPDGRRVVRQVTSRSPLLAAAFVWAASLTCVIAGQAQTTVWSGVYTEAQAFRGEKVADTTCIGCHGPGLDGGDSGPKLVGEMFLANWSSQPVSELFDWIRQAMPPEAAGTLSKEDTAAVVAYILKQNQMPAGKQALPSESEELRRIQLTAVKP